MSREIVVWKKLYTMYIRPHLEFAAPVWNPYLEGDINTLERVQNRATKICMKGINKEKRLKILCLTSLKERRVRGDLIQMYKIVKEIEKVDWYHPQETVPARGRRDAYRSDGIENCKERSSFFTNRIISEWNLLPDDVVSAPSIDSFKERQDTHRKSKKSCHSASPTV